MVYKVMSEVSLKTCKSCGGNKPLTEYYQSIRADCKVCCRSKAKVQRVEKAIKELEVERIIQELAIKEEPKTPPPKQNPDSSSSSDDETVVVKTRDIPRSEETRASQTPQNTSDMTRVQELEKRVHDLETLMEALVARITRLERRV